MTHPPLAVGLGLLLGLDVDVMVVRAQRLPVRPIPEEGRVSSVPLLMVYDQMQATRVRFGRTVLVVDARIEQPFRFAAHTKLVIRESEECSAFLLPSVRLVPLSPRLLITVPVVLALPLWCGRPRRRAEGLWLPHTLG